MFLFESLNAPLLIFCGLSGSGKTYNATYVAQQLPSYERVGPGILREELGITTYSRKDTPLLLAKTIERIEEQDKKGKGSVLDANLKTLDLRQCFYDLAKHLKREAIIIEFYCDEATALQRMQERTRTTLAENPRCATIYHAQKKAWQDFSLDVEQGNAHVSFIRYNTQTHEPIILQQTEKSKVFITQLLSLLQEKEKQ